MKTKESSYNVMDAIIEVALRSKFKDIDTNVLLKVINATPNANIATAMLLGIFEEPVLSGSAVNLRDDQIGEAIYISHNVFTDEVRFSYQRNNIKKRYYKTEEDAKAGSSDEWTNCEPYRTGTYTVERVWDLGITTSEAICSIDKWMSNAPELP